MKKHIESMAMFMICLIITIPVYVSSVYADINDVNSYGAQGIEDFVVKEYDLTIEAEVTGSPAASDMKLKSGPLYTFFDSCSSSSNTSSICTINLVYGQSAGLEICPSNSFTVEQYSGSTFPIDTETFTVKCDSQAPTTTLSLSPQQTNGEDVVLSYTITDPQNSATQCSGVDKIEFYTSVSSSPATLSVNSTGCSYTDSTSISASSYSDGYVTVYMKVYDKMGQSSIANNSFTVDQTGPDAAASVKITDTSGNQINYFTPGNVLVDVTLNITDLTGVSDYSLDYSSLTSISPTCSTSGTNVICKWNDLTMNMGNASFTKTITMDASDNLGNDASRSINVQGTITQDLAAPTIVVSDITIDTIDGSVLEWYRPGEMKMNFSAVITEDLSGIKDIQGDFSNIDVISGDTPSCIGSGNSYACTWSNLRFNIDSAIYSKSISIIAEDNAGNIATGTKTASISYRDDASGPTMSGVSIVPTSGSFDEWIGDETIPVYVYANITELGSGLESAYANFESINPSYKSYFEGSCNQLTGTTTTTTTTSTGIYSAYISPNATNVSLPESTYECTWSTNIHFNESGNPYSALILFNATDNSLNSIQTTFSKSFKVDIDGPTVSSLTTSRLWNNSYYVGMGDNTYIAAVSDAGVGINNSNIYLDLTGAGYAAKTKADNCSNGYCYWTTLGCGSISEGIHTISVTTDSIDDLGNSLSTAFSKNVTIDKTYPTVNSINVTAVASSTQIYKEYIQTGNAMDIILNITEATSLLSATGDFSNFISNVTEDLADDCTQTNSSWLCQWATDEIDISSYNKDNLYFNITDVAGNSYIYSYEIEVMESLTGNVSYWDHSVGASSPTAIDRQIVSLYNPFMWFPIALTSSEGKSAADRWPLEVVLDNCFDPSSTGNSSTSTSSVNYLLSSNGNLPLMINPNTDTPTSLPYNMHFNYELEQSAPDNTTDSIDITCSLKIRTLVDQQKIGPYETENITVTINYYNNALGTLDTNIQDEIDDVKDGWLVSAEWIGQISQIMSIAQKLCGLVSKIYGIAKIIGGIADGFKSSTVTQPVGMSLGTVSGVLGATAEESWKGYVNAFCKFVNCQLFYGADWGGGDEATGAWATYGRWKERYSQYLNPKDSLIWSIVYLCLPGIIYNLQKARVIECGYIRCLESTAYGMPLQMCVKQRDYQWCSYVYGQVFNIIPFSGLFNQLMGNIKAMLAQPAQMINVGLSAVCKISCPTPKPSCLLCHIYEGTTLLLDVLCDLGIGSDQCEPFWEDLTIDDTACQDVLE